VIFQSQFCLDACKALTSTTPPRYEVLYNAVPPVSAKVRRRTGDGRTLWLSGVFTPDAEHILRPALEALRLLRRGRNAGTAPRLLIAGYFSPETVTHAWYGEMVEAIREFEAEKAITLLGRYEACDLPALAATADVALHLKYKDPCPNAVLERMALGLGHVYSGSGGTPELVGEAGIGIDVEDSWDRQVAVDAERLADAIERALADCGRLSEAATEQSHRFDWNAYLGRHDAVFRSLLECGELADSGPGRPIAGPCRKSSAEK
jgi:glycosyltransferase involved in cell wall biosynthesis